MLRRSLLLLCTLVCTVLAVVILLQGTAVHAGTICVVSGPGAPISSALAGAMPGDTIRVAAGDYTENLVVAISVTLEGGWDASCSNRDVAANVTTIRPADNTQSVVIIQGNAPDSAAVAPVLDGFTITGGRADLGGNHGGGLKIVDSDAIVRNNIISGNVAALLGGGIWIQRGAPLLENNRIENNLSSGDGLNAYGGGVQLEDSRATLTANIIANNEVSGDYGYGGGVDVSGGGPVLFEGNTIDGNKVVVAGNTIARGAGVALRSVTATLSSDIIESNVITGFLGFGGGLYIDDSAVAMNDGLIAANVASTNGSGDGGGIYASGSDVTLEGVQILENVSTPENAGGGGGASLWETEFTLASSVVAGNQSSTIGGVTVGNESMGQVFNSTFAANEFAAIQATGAMGAESSLKVLNSIFVGHEVAIIQSGDYVTMDVTYNDFFDNDTDAQGFTLDPATNLFVDPQLSGDYHLMASSPVIDAGFGLVVYGFDIDGEPRAMAGASGLYMVDIGADEFTGPAQVYRHLAEEPADFTLIGPGGPLEDANAEGQNDWIGSSVLGGDVNGDGRDDLVAGARNFSDVDGAVNDSGRIFALYNDGSRRSGVYDLYDQPSDLEVRSYLHQQHIGNSLLSVHVGGDNSSDLIIGSVGGMNGNEPVTGTVYAFAGGPSLSGVKMLSPTMQATWRLKSGESTLSFADLGALAGGQLNGSGAADLVVGESQATGPGNRQSAGAVNVFFGGSLPAEWDLAQMPASLTIYGPASDAQLGLVTVADVDGDGQADLLARSGSAAYVFYGPLSSGSIDLATTSADATITGLDFGPLSAGNVDGDGSGDLLLGDGEDVVLVRGGALSGSQTIAEAESARFTGLGSLSSFVQLHSFDWDGDGRDDVIVGDAQVNLTYIVFGRQFFVATAPILASADWIIEGVQNDEQLGFSLGSGDLDDDGAQDLIIGSRRYDASENPAFFQDAGAVYVLYGSPTVSSDSGMLFLPVAFGS